MASCRRAAWLVPPLVTLVVLASACAREAAGAGDATQEPASPAAGASAPGNGSAPAVEPKPAPPAVLAEATNPGIPLVVQVIEARRVTADTVRIGLAFTNTSTSQEPIANPSDFCLIAADGSRRLFLLRDAQNKPVLDGNWQPLKPGERRVVQAMFPAPPAQAGRVTMLLGKLVVRDVPISQ